MTAPPPQAAEHAAQRTVLRNTAFLVAAQALGMPLSLLMTIVAARYLGAISYGQLYLATTFTTLAFVFVEWGQGIALTGALARQREDAGELLASSLALRVLLAPLALAGMLIASYFFGYDAGFRVLLVLVTLGALATSMAGALQDTVVFISTCLGESEQNPENRRLEALVGRIIADGDPETVMADPGVIDAYLGGSPA